MRSSAVDAASRARSRGEEEDRLQLLKPQFPYHVESQESDSMSFAGPILRRSRTRANGSMLPEPTDRGPLASSGRRALLDPDRPNRALIFAAGIAVGALLGAAAALLAAPQSGEETRRAITRHSRRLARRGREMVDDFGDGLRRQRNAVKRRFASIL
jgi:YtxH-like protein